MPDLTLRFFLQMLVILAACRAVGWIARGFGQPQVVAEMIAGVLLGPSLLGLLAPDWQHHLFPKASLPILHAVAQAGLALYMFLIGIEFRTELFRSRLKGAIAVSAAGIVVPFVLGAGLGLVLVQDAGAFFTAHTRASEAAVFLGASMCITAFPMLARIIHERGLSGTALGTLVLAAGALDDAAAWGLLALVLSSASGDWAGAMRTIGGAILYAAAVLTGGARLMAMLAARAQPAGEITETALALVLMAVMLGAWTTEAVGVHAVFGAFLLGAAMPRGAFSDRVRARLEPFVVTFLLPVFFVYSGLNTRLDLIDSPAMWLAMLAALAVAVIGKGAGCWAAARLSGEDQPTALAVGTLMNARGLMELIIINIGLQRGIITPTLFTILVMMAIVTTLVASPLFERVYGRAAREQGVLGTASR